MPKIIIPFLVLFLSACSQQEAENKSLLTPQIAQVKTLTLSPKIWQDRIDVYGIVEAAEEIHLSVNFSGSM